jgi:hypothetical protein
MKLIIEHSVMECRLTHPHLFLRWPLCLSTILDDQRSSAIHPATNSAAHKYKYTDQFVIARSNVFLLHTKYKYTDQFTGYTKLTTT